MKKIRILFAVLSTIFVYNSCEKQPPAAESFLSLDTKLSEFSDMAGCDTVYLSASGEWTSSISDNSDWCTLDRPAGKGNTQIAVSVSSNKGSRRSATVVFSSEKCKDVQLIVIQEAAKVRSGLYAMPEIPDADKSCVLYYKADAKSPFYNFTGDLYAHIGLVDGEWFFVQADWNQNIDKCKWRKSDEANLWSLPIEPDIRQWFGSGETEVVSIGVVVRNSDGTKQTEDLFLKVRDNKYAFTPDAVVKEPVPAGMKLGINYNNDNSVTFVFYDKDKNGKAHDYCYLIGAFSNWKRSSEYAMKRDDDAGCWWYTLGGLNPEEEYLFQYHVGYTEGNAVKLSDPYSETVYDPWNDKYISSSTYPGLTPYPAETNGLVSAFETGGSKYNWEVPDFKIKDKNNLVIYEVLIRDFNTSKDLNGVMAKLDYIEDLNVNAIELMPVQEFDGNSSWGYNPNHYFALDKAYGTKEMYKKFIDECHKRGIAVIFDVVYNHATGLHPMAKLYFSGKNTAPENPWFNVTAPHPYSVFHDWNHENQMVRDHIKRSLEYLLTEYNIDGFRFDLTKGFTQNKSTEATVSNYDRSRIEILKDYNNKIVEVNPDAVVILEHFCNLDEEKVLGEAGMKLWRKLNGQYAQTAMGYKTDSSFEPLYAKDGMPFGSCVGFMESHDEERCAYKAMQYGIPSVKNSIAVRMQRAKLNAAFFLTVPGPKMIWQFGELGYDISIDENGRTGEKPVKWNYLDVPERKALHDTYSRLLKFRKDNPELFDENADFQWSVSESDWPVRSISCTAGGKSFIITGNFGDSDQTFEIEIPSGTFYDYFDSAQTYNGGTHTLTLAGGEFKMMVNF